MSGKFKFYWFFHGLMISEKISTKIIKNNLLGVAVKYVIIQFLQKKLCFAQNLLCFVGLYFPRSCLVLVAYNKTNIPCLFCLMSKLCTLGNVIYLGWIISDIKQKDMEYLVVNL